MKFRFLSLVIGLLLYSCSLFGQRLSAEQYIAKYKDIAIAEMVRTGIPASITLAQGILESDYGGSFLATDANNHFGIKCHDWEGPSVRFDDDAPQECFRKYSSANLSYLDHSEFLLSRERYFFIFDYPSNDYVNWAKGLKKAGYATNPKYAELLISLIERNNLGQFDKKVVPKVRPQVPEPIVVVPEPSPTPTPVPVPIPTPDKPGNIDLPDDGLVTTFNGKKIVRYESPIYLKRVAAQWDISYQKLLKFNDLSRHAEIPAGTAIFLQKKRNKAATKNLKHKVRKGETLWSIAQKYGVKLKKVYKRNKMSYGEMAAVGEVIYINTKRDRSPKITRGINGAEVPAKAKDQTFIPPKKPEPPRVKPIDPSKNGNGSKGDGTKPDNSGSMNTTKYVVQKGDTLYGLSKRFSTNVATIKKINGLSSDNLSIGQELIMPHR